METPVLVDCYDWTTDRLIFSVLVWPSLESSGQDASYDHHQRVEAVLEAIAKGAAEKMWSTYWEVDYGLRWNHKRQVWTAQDGFAYEPPESDNRAFGVGPTAEDVRGGGCTSPHPAQT